MVVVKLQGGLGNQMFQYAAGRSLTDNNESFYIDLSFFKNSVSHDAFTARKYELNIFKKLKAKKASRLQLNLFNSSNIIFRINRKMLNGSIKYLQQKENKYLGFHDLSQYNYIYLDGYFQCDKYFKNIRTELLEEFSFPKLDDLNEETVKEIEQRENAVSVHIRRGDYLKAFFNDVHGLLPLAYYYKAINTLQKGYKNISLYIFSDDMQWAKENFAGIDVPVSFIDFNIAQDSWKDMALMSSCKHHIVANSSFSWWGAWLSEKGGEIFAPCNWFNRLKVEYTIHDYVPESWKIIEYEQ